jgi:hypothetical protein
LNGISDDKLDMGPKCVKFLEDHGLRMRDALKALGEYEEEHDQEMQIEDAPTNQNSLLIQEIKSKNQEAEENKTEYSNSAMEDID